MPAAPYPLAPRGGGPQRVAWHRRLPTRLVGVVLLAALLLAVAYGTFGDAALTRLLYDAHRDRLATQSSATAAAVGAITAGAVADLEALADHPALDPQRDVGQLTRDLALVEPAASSFTRLAVLDATATIVAKPSAVGQVGSSRAGRVYADALMSGETVVEPVVVEEGVATVSVAVPLRTAGDEPVGLLAGTLRLEGDEAALTAPVLAPDLPPGWTVRLVDDADVLIAATSTVAQVPTAIEEPITTVGADLSGDPVIEAARSEGEAAGWLAAAAQVPGSTWLVVTQEPIAVAAGEINPTRVRLAAAASAVILLAAAVALLIGRRSVERISQLTQALRRVAAGGQPVRLDEEGTDEIAGATRAFNRMLEERERTNAELAERRAELERAAAARTETLRRYLLALQVGRLGIWEWDVESGEMQWSENMESAYRAVGLPLPTTYEAFIDSVHAEDRHRFEAMLVETVRDSTSLEVEVRLAAGDGNERWLRTIGGAVADAQGFAERVIGVSLDVTAEHEAARTLAARAEREHALAELGRLALAEVAVDALVADVADVVGSVVVDAEVRLLEGPDTDGWLRPILPPGAGTSDTARVQRSALPWADEPPGRVTHDDAGRAVLAAEVPGRGQGWGLLEVTGARIGEDEAAFVRSVATVCAAALARIELDGQLRRGQRLEAVGRLAGVLAHDIMDLLTLQLAHAETLRSDLPAHADPELNAVVDAARAAASLTDHLLAVSRGSEREPVDVDLAELLTRMRGILERLAPEHVEVVIHTAEAAVARFDPNRFEQVILSLAMNACAAMPDGGTLTLRAAVADGTVEVTVADDGIGMDEVTRRRAMEPFFTTRPDAATGLGLATAASAVEGAGGTLTLDSAPGQGTTARVQLPQVTPDPPSTGGPARWPGRILLVEDAPDLAEQLATALAADGHTVTAATSVADAQAQLAHTGTPDLLITNFILTDGSGLDLARFVRADGADVPVLLISGYHQTVVGAGPRVRWLAKPFTPAELRKVTAALLGAGPPPEDR